MIRLLALVLAASLTVPSLSGARAEAGGQPRRIGSIVLIARGPGWKFYGWRTTDGLCLTVYRPSLSDRAFCVRSSELKRAVTNVGCVCRQRAGTTLFIGVVKPVVQRSEVTDRRGVSPVPILLIRGLYPNLRYFRAVAHSGVPPRWRVRFFDGRGKVIGYAGQG